MATSDTGVTDLLRHRARLLGWVLVACVIPGAFLLAAEAAPRIVLTVVFVGAVLVPWVLGPFAVKLKENAPEKEKIAPKNEENKNDFLPRPLLSPERQYAVRAILAPAVPPACLRSDDRYWRYRTALYVAKVVATIMLILSAICWVVLHFL